DRSRKRLIADCERMNAIEGRHLLRKIFDVESDRLHDCCLSTTTKFLQIGHNDRVQNSAPCRAAIFRKTQYANLFAERRLRIMRFEFFRVNVFSVGKDNHVVASSGDRELPTRVDETEVARAEPAILNCLGGFVGCMKIPLHHNWPAYAYFTYSVGVRSVHANAHPADRLSDCADAVVVGGCDGCRSRGLRETVRLEDQVP